jgi:CRP-like cAMP-binding protein
MLENLKSIIGSYQKISEKSLQEILNGLVFETIQKGEVFIKLDDRNSKEYFLFEGVCKSYLRNPKGEEITISFFTENSVLSPHQTRTFLGKSILSFKALTNLTMASIDSKKFEDLMIDNIEIRNFAHQVLQQELMHKIQKEIGLATLTAKERLAAFREQFKLLENTVPHTDIATYLGITNISLSRIRKEFYK